MMGGCYCKFGWKDVNVEVFQGVVKCGSEREAQGIAWRKVQEEWDQEMETKPKLEILKRIVKLGECLEGQTGVCP